jgi:hypothetical protein
MPKILSHGLILVSNKFFEKNYIMLSEKQIKSRNDVYSYMIMPRYEQNLERIFFE